MSSSLLRRLRNVSDVTWHEGLHASALDRLKQDCGLVLPPEHQAVLERSNGIEVFAGHVRLFGVGTEACIDAKVWNSQDHWKFAWSGRCSAYWCFAESAWGDQYAYRIDEIRPGASACVYQLDALSMTASVLTTSFGQFLEDDFFRCACDPYDIMLKAARERFGPIGSDEHLVYMPSLLLGAPEDIGNAHRMPARLAMICNGDIAIQLDEGPAEKSPTAVESYEDDQRRTRLRLLWS